MNWLNLPSVPLQTHPKSPLFCTFAVSYNKGLLRHTCYPTCTQSSFLLYVTDSSLSSTLDSLCKVLYAASYIKKQIAFNCISKQPGGVLVWFGFFFLYTATNQFSQIFKLSEILDSHSWITRTTSWSCFTPSFTVFFIELIFFFQNYLDDATISIFHIELASPSTLSL